MKKKVGITGSNGFIGTHLLNHLKFVAEGFEIIPFEPDFFSSREKLKSFAEKCDTIIHLAAMNRGEMDVIYKTNIKLVNSIIEACEESLQKPHIIFSSSTQEIQDNLYGKSKKEGRELFCKWSEKNSVKFTGLVTPNVFGAYGKPFYNSVVATFCYQITKNETPKIDNDGLLKIIYVNDLVKRITKIIEDEITSEEYYIDHTKEIRVSEILNKLNYFKKNYIDDNIIPEFSDYFDLCLFNTFRAFLPEEFYPVKLNLFKDNRGHLAEVIKARTGGQVFFSLTNPGIVRGNHFHTRKIERFCVVEGKASIQLRKINTSKVIEYVVDGNEPAIIDIPIFYTHNIRNIGTEKLCTIFWTNEFFDHKDSDTYFMEV